MTDEMQQDGRAIADLLPWYATGRLSGRDRQRVAVALASDVALQRELALILEEQAAAIEANEALGAPSHHAVDRFFAALDARVPAKKPRGRATTWALSRFADWSPQTLAWAAMAAAVIVVAQGSVIGVLLSARPTTFAVSSVNPAAGIRSGGSLLISFDPAATVDAIQHLLEDSGISIVDGPLPGGLYKLRLGDRPLTKNEMDEIVARLKTRRGLVRFVAPASAPD